DAERAAVRAQQLAAIDPDWNCPWPLNWQRHYRHLTALAADETDGVLPDIAPGVLMNGDDIGRWLQQQRKPATWARLLPKQQERLTGLGIKPLETPAPAPPTRRATKGPNKAQQAFQRGLTALAQWVEREGAHRPVPRGHAEEITVDGEPVVVKLGVWISNTKSRRDRLAQEQLNALRELGLEWA
ncbi:Helicase associated domain protein, partial [Streptomyces sp. NPDC007904]|uniref:helicase associated domain-containing protein n=1 Tax=Streptomyces sp. NPDC007904 TaxID=3364787 RepID=UPI0036E9DFED